jgi:hypothetical protein
MSILIYLLAVLNRQEESVELPPFHRPLEALPSVVSHAMRIPGRICNISSLSDLLWTCSLLVLLQSPHPVGLRPLKSVSWPESSSLQMTYLDEGIGLVPLAPLHSVEQSIIFSLAQSLL